MIIQPVDTGNKSHPYGHALVAGIERYPSKITRRMSKTRQEKRSKIKPFVKVVNYNHLMPTRYTLELEGLKGAVTSDTFKEVSQREEAKKTVKKTLEERYTSGKNRWFFTPLSTSTLSKPYTHFPTRSRDSTILLCWTGQANAPKNHGIIFSGQTSLCTDLLIIAQDSKNLSSLISVGRGEPVWIVRSIPKKTTKISNNGIEKRE